MPNVSPARKGWVSKRRIRAPEARQPRHLNRQSRAHHQFLHFQIKNRRCHIEPRIYRDGPRAGGPSAKRKPSPEGLGGQEQNPSAGGAALIRKRISDRTVHWL